MLGALVEDREVMPAERFQTVLVQGRQAIGK
jgi:hypothetical protein